MEREPTALYGGTSAIRSTRAQPVLQVNVRYGVSGEETAMSAAGPLGSVPTNSAAVAASLRVSAVTPSRAATSGAYSAISSSRRTLADGVSQNAGPVSLTAANGSGAAGPSSSLAKPVLDPAQVRCCPLDQWVPEAHVVNCMAPDCTNSFSLFSRKHRCRMCGRVFCASCCSNVVAISAAVAARTMPGGMPDGGIGSANAYGGSGGGGQALSPDPAGASAGAASTNASCNTSGFGPSSGSNHAGAGWRGAGEDAPAGSASPAVMSPTTTTAAAGGGAAMEGGAASPGGYPAPSPAANTTSPVPPSTVQFRVCASCSYEVQLVVSTRQENGEVRRRSRGELKMLQRVLLVNVMTYLNLLDLASVALVSADFYFMSRDNIIWYQYNMTRWVQEGDAMQLSSLKSRAAALKAQQQRGTSWYSGGGGGGGGSGGGGSSSGGGGGGGAASSLADDIFKSTPAIQDATALSESEAAKRVISLHARYNYTQFLDFARRQEMARCEGLSSFSLGARILLSSPLRVAVVGPCGIGKTAAVTSFLGTRATQMVVRPTIGFQRRAVSVRLAGGLSTEVTLHVYDLSGADRYEELRRFVCRHCHAVALCYDPNAKVTLVQAADVMMELEPVLGPQPVVVCGLLRKGHHSSSTTAATDPRVGGGAAAGSSNGGGPPPPSLPTSRSAGSLDPTHPRRTLALESQSAAASPVGAGAAAAGAANPFPPTANDCGNSSNNGLQRQSVESSTAPSMAEAARTTSALSEAETAAAAPSEPTLPHANTFLAMPTGGVAPLSPPHSPPSVAASAVNRSAGAAAAGAAAEVTVEDAVGITVRGLASIQCPITHSAPLFEALVQAVLDRLAEATVATTTTISDISAELAMQSADAGPSASMTGRLTSTTNRGGVAGSAMRSSVRRRRPVVSRTIVKDLLNLTMQPCALDILLDRK